MKKATTGRCSVDEEPCQDHDSYSAERLLLPRMSTASWMSIQVSSVKDSEQWIVASSRCRQSMFRGLERDRLNTRSRFYNQGGWVELRSLATRLDWLELPTRQSEQVPSERTQKQSWSSSLNVQKRCFSVSMIGKSVPSFVPRSCGIQNNARLFSCSCANWDSVK